MGRIETDLCRTLGIEHPIVQAPIESNPELVAAVAEAGGLGTLSITWNDPETARELIGRTQKLTGRPFAVNIVIDPDSKETSTEAAIAAAIDAGVDIYSLSFGEAEPYVERIHEADGIVLQTVSSAKEAAEAEAAGVDIVVT